VSAGGGANGQVQELSDVQSFLPSMEGEERKVDKSQWYTPPKLAAAMARWAVRAAPRSASDAPLRVLEPSAGRGSLVRAVLAAAVVPTRVSVTAYDTDEGNVAYLHGLYAGGIEVRHRDFLAHRRGVGRFDVACMNPPYEHDQDVDHIWRALRLAPRAVCLVRSAFDHADGRFKKFWRWVDPVREARLVSRPKFGGKYTPKGDFKVYELVKRTRPRRRGEPVLSMVEWW